VIRVVKLVAVFVFALLSCSAGNSQGTDASLTGIVTDPSRAAISNAKVTAKNKLTNWSQEVTTDGSGSYSILSMPIGQYVVTVELNGFNTASVEMTLETAQKGRQDFELQVGQTTQTITVESATQNLSTQDASLGAVIDNNVVSDTPLFEELGRSAPTRAGRAVEPIYGSERSHERRTHRRIQRARRALAAE